MSDRRLWTTVPQTQKTKYTSTSRLDCIIKKEKQDKCPCDQFLKFIRLSIFSAQIPELTKCSVLMRERGRVEETIQAMQRAGADSLQVSRLKPHLAKVFKKPGTLFFKVKTTNTFQSLEMIIPSELCISSR